MDQVFYVLAIMGCGDDASACQQARFEPARYESRQACQAALPAALERNLDLDFPTIAADCRRSSVRFVESAPRSSSGR